jgi:hypothetical protein
MNGDQNLYPQEGGSYNNNNAIPMTSLEAGTAKTSYPSLVMQQPSAPISQQGFQKGQQFYHMRNPNSIPVPIIVVQQSPSSSINSSSSEKAPLIAKTSQPKKKGKSCCCIFACISCCCCLLMFTLIGSAVGFYAYKCTSMNYQSTDYLSVDATSAVQFSFTTTNGAIEFLPQVDGSTNVTVLVTKKASSQGGLNELTSTLSNNNGNIVFSESSLTDSSDIFSYCKYVEVKVWVPQGAVVFSPTAQFSASSVNGNIDMDFSGVATYWVVFSSINIGTTNGHVSLNNVNAGTVIATSTNGNVDLTNINSTSIFLGTTNGDVSLSYITMASFDGYSPNLRATSTNGNIRASGIQDNIIGVSYELSTTNGDVDASLDSFSGTFNAKNSNGDISVSGNSVTFITNQSNMKTGFVGNGTSSLTASTTNGDVNLSFN